jgi:hypothetical protein
MARTELTLIMPGLATVLSQEINKATIPTYLTKLINKAKRYDKAIGLSRTLFNHFNDNPLTGRDLPIGDLLSTKQPIIKADPCYLHADRDRLLLFAKGLTITEQESAELIDEIQPLLAEMGDLRQASPTDWQLALKQTPDIQFSAIEEVEGKGVDSYLPVGQDRKQWLTLWNEIQMQLYQADLNQHRIASQQLPINSVWFWGMGTFSPTSEKWVSLSGKSHLLSELAAKTQSLVQTEPPSTWSAGEHLWLLEGLDTESDWQATLQALDKTVFEPLWKQVSKAKIDQLIIQIPDFAEYHITSFSRWQFWR